MGVEGQVPEGLEVGGPDPPARCLAPAAGRPVPGTGGCVPSGQPQARGACRTRVDAPGRAVLGLLRSR